MFLKTTFAACTALALASFATTADAAGCTGSSRQRIDCLEKQLDAMTAKLASAADLAAKAKATADEALKKVGEVKMPDLTNIRLQWRIQRGSCLYVEDGSGTVRVATTKPATCDADAQQRFDILLNK